MNITPYIALYLFFAGCWILYRNYNVRRWPSVEGKLIFEQIGSAVTGRAAEDFDVMNYVQDDKISAQVEYLYSVNGVDYIGDRLSFAVIHGSMAARVYLKKQFDAVGRLGGDKVIVFYNEARPKKSVLIIPGLLNDLGGLLCLTLSISFIFIGPIYIDF